LYQKGIHLKALKKGLNAPTCVSCHGDHNITSSGELISSVNKNNVPKTCSKCHVQEYQEYTQSDHWRAFLMNIKESPVCNDCHLEHSIQESTDPTSPTYPQNIPTTCASCHETQRIIERYGIPSMRLSSFSDSYHGLALKGGNLYAANCASCHDNHLILSSRNPLSKTNPKNLSKTCGQCHPGISETKSVGKIHSKPPEKQFIFNLVTTIYIYLIVITIGSMIIYCLLDFQKKALHPKIQKAHDYENYYIKFSPADRLIHAVHMISFFILVYTGFVHHYPEASWAKIFTNAFGEPFRAIVHRVAGSIMLLVFIIQILLFIFTKHGKEQFKALLPNFQDIKDAINLALYNLNIKKNKPPFGIFSFIEKFEYWALVWGNIIMGLTGIALWFENFTLSIIAKWWLDLFILIHFYEAILASLAILIWHLYWTVFDPEVYPFAKSIWTGKAPCHYAKK
jgi:formate dehydrogenase gamma subunit